MKVYEVITLLAILVGPVLAVLVQLASETRSHLRNQQNQTLRMMASARHLPGDASYSTAINIIPIDFNQVPKVMAAHRSYIETITYDPAPENVDAHHKQVLAKQTKLLFEMAKHLGYDLPETDIQTSAYAARGFIERDNLMIEGWRAWQRIALALEAQSAPPSINPFAEKL
jgi:hypothetical protein